MSTTPDPAPDPASLVRLAGEVAEVLESLGHEAFAPAVGLRNALLAGLAPPPTLVAGVRAALERALAAAAKESSPQIGIDTGLTKATRSTLRGLLKRFEDAFGRPASDAR